jgi:hypothetical protein
MGLPTTFRDYRLSSAALEKLNRMWGRLRTALERSPCTASCHRALSSSRRLAGGMRGAPPSFGSLPHPQSIQFVPLRVSSDPRHAASLELGWRTVFEVRDCRTSGLRRARRTNLGRFAPFVQIREIRRPVTPRHRRSVPHGNPNYVV